MTLNLKNVHMNYLNYETAIVEKYHVTLVGWPSTLPFANPSNIGTVGDIRTLRDALKVGECKWTVQTKRQQAAHAETLKSKRAAGEVVGKKRKIRSDKGKKRKAVVEGNNDNAGDGDHGDDDGGAQPIKKKKKSHIAVAGRTSKSKGKVPPTPKSKEFIEDDEDDEEDEDDE